MLKCPKLWLEPNARRLPSGDQIGRPSFAGYSVNRVRTPRTASVSHTSTLPPIAPHEAIRFASGDNSTSFKAAAGALIVLTTEPIRSNHLTTSLLSAVAPAPE